MAEFDPKVQTCFDGPLACPFQQRILAAKRYHRIGYWELARLAGVSESFVASMTRSNVNVRTSTATRIVSVIEKMEAEPI